MDEYFFILLELFWSPIHPMALSGRIYDSLSCLKNSGKRPRKKFKYVCGARTVVAQPLPVSCRAPQTPPVVLPQAGGEALEECPEGEGLSWPYSLPCPLLRDRTKWKVAPVAEGLNLLALRLFCGFALDIHALAPLWSISILTFHLLAFSRASLLVSHFFFSSSS